jgi:hypothetical protein
MGTLSRADGVAAEEYDRASSVEVEVQLVVGRNAERQDRARCRKVVGRWRAIARRRISLEVMFYTDNMPRFQVLLNEPLKRRKVEVKSFLSHNPVFFLLLLLERAFNGERSPRVTEGQSRRSTVSFSRAVNN